MKKNVFMLLTSLLFSLTVEAQAQEGCYDNSSVADRTNSYFKIFGSANFLQNNTISGNKTNYHTGYVISGSLGYCWCNGFCLEGEYAFRRNAISKMDIVGEGSSHHGYSQASSYMANLSWNLPLDSWGCTWGNIRSFIGAGIGYDFQQMHSSNSRIVFNQKWHHFSWQIMAGLAYPLFCHTHLTLEYKFHQGSSHFYNHSLGAGLVYKFGLRTAARRE